jgi:hypothetical protein
MNQMPRWFSVEAGKQADRLVKTEVIDVAATFFVQEFECQQTQQRAGRWDRLHVSEHAETILEKSLAPHG